MHYFAYYYHSGYALSTALGDRSTPVSLLPSIIMHVIEWTMNVSRAKPAATRDTDAYLGRLGERVRTLRNQRGMTRKALARHAKVSERYLAQLEAGLGNGSIVLLRRIARAIGLPITQLVHEGTEPVLDFVLLSQFLERLPPATLAEARELLLERFGKPSEDARRRRIALIGLRGGGKSTLGRLLAERLSIPFIELDREIERRSGATLSEIFDMFAPEFCSRHERQHRHGARHTRTSARFVFHGLGARGAEGAHGPGYGPRRYATDGPQYSRDG